MSCFHIAVLLGDGIGPEVVRAGIAVLRAAESRLHDVSFTTEVFCPFTTSRSL